MQVVLVMFRGEGERRSFSIVRDVTVIGRREDCDFRIPLGEISRKHCRLIKDGDTLRAEDLGSSNGTYVNGVRVQEAELQPGDTLKVGSVVFVVQIDGVPSEADLQPAQAVPDSALDVPHAEHEHLNPTAQSEVGSGDELSAQDGDQLADVGQTIDEAVPEEADQYDPMALLAHDPDSSSIGSMVEDDRIAEDLIIELESRDHGGQANP